MELFEAQAQGLALEQVRPEEREWAWALGWALEQVRHEARAREGGKEASKEQGRGWALVRIEALALAQGQVRPEAQERAWERARARFGARDWA